MKIPILVTSYIVKKEYEDQTRECIASLTSKNHLLDIRLDNRDCPDKLSQKWNEFARDYSGYEYIIIMANDTLAKPQSIDFMIDFMDQNPEVSVGQATMERNKETFLNTPLVYDGAYTHQPLDTCNFIIRKGTFDDVGYFNQKRYPFSMGERDWLYRCSLAGRKVGYHQNMKLFWHPPVSMTQENRGNFSDYQQAYIEQWGGLDLQERYIKPFDNPTYSLKWDGN